MQSIIAIKQILVALVGCGQLKLTNNDKNVIIQSYRLKFINDLLATKLHQIFTLQPKESLFRYLHSYYLYLSDLIHFTSDTFSDVFTQFKID